MSPKMCRTTYPKNQQSSIASNLFSYNFPVILYTNVILLIKQCHHEEPRETPKFERKEKIE